MQASQSLSRANERGLMRSLEQKLLAALLLLGIIPLVVMAVMSFLRARGALEDSVNNELKSVADLTEDRVDRWLAAREIDARTFSSAQFVAGDEQDALTLGLDVIVSQEGTTEGTTASRAAKSGIIDILEATGTTYTAIYLTDRNGKILLGVKNDAVESETTSMTEDYNTGHEFESFDALVYRRSFNEQEEIIPFFEALPILEGPEFAQSPVVTYTFTVPNSEEAVTVTTMFFARAVQDASTGRIVGSVVLEVNPAELQNLMGTFADGKGETYWQSGDYLISQDTIEPMPASSR